MRDNYQQAENVTVITPRSGWFDVNIAELWRYRDLIMLLVRRDTVAIYKQTVFGPFWFLIQPIATTLVFTVIFGKIARIPTGGVPPILFYMSGVVLWNYFSSCLSRTSDTFIGNAGIFGKIYFPRLVVPLSVVIVNLTTFTLQFGLLACVIAYFSLIRPIIHPTPFILITPLLIIQMALLGVGVGSLISSMTIRYRDLTFFMAFGIQLWMYATPIVYPFSSVPENLKWIMMINPMTFVIETFRYAFLGSGTFDICLMTMSILLTLLFFVLGLIAFHRVEKTFMDTV